MDNRPGPFYDLGTGGDHSPLLIPPAIPVWPRAFDLIEDIA